MNNSQGALVICKIVETSVKISASPLSCAGNSVEAGVFYLNSSSPSAQKVPLLLEYENICLFLLELEYKENTGEVIN